MSAYTLPLLLFALGQGVPLPMGDPIPDFRERPWVPPNLDPSVQNKRGTDFGPCVSFTVQLSPNEFVRRGLTVRLPDKLSICYDTDTLATPATWSGGFLDVSKTHFEDEKGSQPGRPGGDPLRWVQSANGWAGVTAKEIEYLGHFLHGFNVVLNYRIHGREIQEMPGSDLGSVTRTFLVAPSTTALELVIAEQPGLTWNLPSASMAQATGRAVRLVHGEQCRLVSAKGLLHLVIPASTKYQMFKIALAANTEKLPAEDALVADLRHYVRDDPGRWESRLITIGQLGTAQNGYAVDTLTLPTPNPWKSWVRPAAFDFFDDGRIAMSSMSGDIWIVSGVDAKLSRLVWQRFATGIYEPLGLKVVKGMIYVLGRDRITQLHDRNNDGEADYYESFFAGGVTPPGYHAFSFDLQTDSKGNFYFVKSGRKADEGDDQNAVIRVSPDGKSWSAIAHGFRHPNGMGIGPDDQIVVSDNQGEFVPASKVSRIKEGGYYGYGPKPLPHEYPLFYLPMKEDNSSGGQLWAGDKWGPLSGKMLHTSYGSCKLFCCLPQYDGERVVQTSVIPLSLPFRSGIMCGRVNPVDGQVYVSGLRGWGTTAKDDGCLQRVRYTGEPSLLIEDVKLLPEGMQLTFSQPLDATATTLANYQAEQWHYLYSEKYGSPEFSVRVPNQVGRDPVVIQAAKMSENGRILTLQIDDLQPVDQFHLSLNVKSREGVALTTDVYSTIPKR